MKYEWNPEKNEWLKNKGNISFEQIIFHLSQGDVWKITDHPDQTSYPGQKLYLVVIDDYNHKNYLCQLQNLSIKYLIEYNYLSK